MPRMHIARVDLRGVGPFEDASFLFPDSGSRIILFEGPNGCGKTTIAQAIAVAVGHRDLFASREDGLQPPSSTFARRFRGDDGGVTVSIADEVDRCAVTLSGAGDERVDVRSQGLEASNRVAARLRDLRGPASRGQAAAIGWAAFAYRGFAQTAQLESQGPGPLEHPPLLAALSFGAGTGGAHDLGQFLTNVEFDRVQAKLYASEKPAPEAQRLARIAESRAAVLTRLQDALSSVLDRDVAVEFLIGQRAPRIRFDGEIVPLDLLGEGMRNTVSWLSNLIVRLERVPWASPDVSPFDQELWLLLDEIEESLHPTMQLRLFPALLSLFPRARIYATTHSPFVVASLGEGHVFSIRPDPRTHRVSGALRPVALTPGRSLEWAVEEVFAAPTGIVDPATRGALDLHRRDVDALRRQDAIDWKGFLERRERLSALNEEVRAILRMTEAPVRRVVEAKLREEAA